MGVVAWLVTALHALEGFAWALAYRLLGAVGDMTDAVLYSFSAMTAYGHASVVLERRWQLMGALEALNGLMLFGLTTAFMFAMIGRVGRRRPGRGFSSGPARRWHFSQAMTEATMFIRNAWYVAAWADEIGEAPLARRICNEPVVLYPRPAGPRRRAARHVLPSRRAAAHGQGRRRGARVRLPRADLRPFRRLRARPGPGPHPRAHPRPQLSRGRAGRLPVDLDGRSGPGRSRDDRALAVSQRRGELAAQAHDVSDQGRRHADGGQPDGPDASGLRPRLDHRRQSGAARRGEDGDGAHATRAEVHPLDAELGAAADLREGGGFEGRIDRCQRFEFVAPGSVLQWTGAAEAGAYRDGNTDDSKLAVPAVPRR